MVLIYLSFFQGSQDNICGSPALYVHNNHMRQVRFRDGDSSVFASYLSWDLNMSDSSVKPKIGNCGAPNAFGRQPPIIGSAGLI